MLTLGNDEKVHAYGTLLELESRAQEFAGLVLKLKDQLINRSEIMPPEVVGSIDDLFWHLRKSAKLLPVLERAIGVERKHMRRRTAAATRPAEEGLRGTTKSIAITDVLGLLAAQGKTGTLWIKTQDELFLLEFSEGAVVHASTNRPLPEHRVGTILVARSKVSQEKLEGELAKANNAPIGETMLRAELVSEDDLRNALEHQIQELFHRIYSLEDARFAFRDGAVSEVEKRVCLGTTQLLLESARQQDEQARDEMQTQEEPLVEDAAAASEADDVDATEDSSEKVAIDAEAEEDASAENDETHETADEKSSEDEKASGDAAA